MINGGFSGSVRCRVSSGFGMACVTAACHVQFDLVLACVVLLRFLRLWCVPYFVRFAVLFACLLVCVSPCLVALSRLGLSSACYVLSFLCTSFAVVRASARLVQFSLSLFCGHWFRLLRHLCAPLLYESPRRKPG